MRKNVTKSAAAIIATVVMASVSLFPAVAINNTLNTYTANTVQSAVQEESELTPLPDETEEPQIDTYTAKSKLPTSAGIEALRNEFTLHQGPRVSGRSNDYALYNPVGENDTNKYPLIIYIHGLMHGFKYGDQLKDSGMPYWASSELQARFEETGAFIMLPRSSNNGKFFFWGSGQIEPLKAAIDDVINSNRNNIDTKKIIIMGSSAGGGMARKMLRTYPDFFGGALIMCQTGFMTPSQVKKLGDMPIWTVATKNDLLVNYWLFQLPIWNTIKNNTSVPEKCRHTVFTWVRYPDGTVPLVSHNLCDVITYDFQMLDGSDYPNCTTVDGNRNPVHLTAGSGIIEWINSFDN